MKPSEFNYVEPDEVDEVCELLAADEEARPLAGGQSLIPMLNFRLVQPTTVVGLRNLISLRHIERSESNVVVGAMVTQRQALEDTDIATGCPLVHDALRHVGHPQIRARGTIGGTIAHADPAAELPAALLAAGGTVTLHGPKGIRSVASDDLFVGPFTTSLRQGEIVTSIRFPTIPTHTGTALVELSRRPGDFAMAGAACQLTVNDGVIADARVALFAVADRPVRARGTEEALKGSPPSPDAWRAAAEVTAENLRGDLPDTRAAGYRLAVTPTVVKRALAQAAGRAG